MYPLFVVSSNQIITITIICRSAGSGFFMLTHSQLFSLLDITRLDNTDHPVLLNQFCDDIRHYAELGLQPAAVCVFPRFLPQVREQLASPEIPVAVVAGGFPMGQTIFGAKCFEVQEAVNAGAHEIDFVINRGFVLADDWNGLLNELAVIRQLVPSGILLKVIIETGDLTPELSYNASVIALEAGADFIKTSTGKLVPGADMHSVREIARAIKDFEAKSGRLKGLKISGGIQTIVQALEFIEMVKENLGQQFITPSTFRIGASRLAKEIATLHIRES